MAVQSITISPRGDAAIRCHWFAGKKLETGVFAAESLELVGEEGESDPKA